MPDFQDILYTIQDRVALVTLNRPEKLNAWTAAMQSSVKRALHAAADDETVRVVVVTGAGRGFCAGADMGNLQKIAPEAVMKAQIWKSLFQDLNAAVAVGDEEMKKSFATADFKEGIAHFVEKRAARFTGR